jgi:hypothetical protein
MRYLSCIVLLIAGVSTALAQSAQTVAPPPPPTLLPQTSTSTSCLVSCDTTAMNCQNGCVVVGPVATGTSPNASCTLACTTQALVCKQGCTR